MTRQRLPLTHKAVRPRSSVKLPNEQTARDRCAHAVRDSMAHDFRHAPAMAEYGTFGDWMAASLQHVAYMRAQLGLAIELVDDNRTLFHATRGALESDAVHQRGAAP